MKKVAVILSGCGVFDGAEIHESVFALLSIAQEGAQFSCFAPDTEQLHVVNHLTGSVEENAQRNVLVESARIARGSIQPVTECNVEEFDAIIVPGGFGVAKNLCTFALDGDKSRVNEQVLAVCKAFAVAKKPAGYACISPALAASVYGNGVKLTIGNDGDTANALKAMGAEHIDSIVDEVVIDASNKLVTTPAYMLAENIVDAHKSISAMVQTVLSMK
ncbi:isoprenoid biosynthesis glyoxalase ElbB [Alteromonas sp. KUL49]|uniref:isoprenoid biosynthesis glyoxalase ElbB n=1 Tax=Alteromonas sp. KUL49 TaxID=2480798 RepID=UPI00102EE7A5|nr:isoprenoid biosynthesis glyoxalase ElbB [Alteromonas sp. KUL49]TAP42064.1 isoprenoid biosynthesis glyoxalase ElbB [Alteromonas sp. KUL49]GEA09640.1 glyoxalase [Alteromonas sp. KUL49]